MRAYFRPNGDNRMIFVMALLINATLYVSVYMPVHVGKEDLMSFETRQTFDTVNYVFFCSIIGLFGITTNSMNMAVFYKQGFKNTMTISFMALAISDIGCLVTLELFCVCRNPLFSSSNLNFVPSEIDAIAGWFHISFARITGCITAYITAERCLCITAPLAIKRIITIKRTACLLILIYAISIVLLIPVCITSYMEGNSHPEFNRTLLGLIVTSDKEKVESVVFLMHSVLILTSFLCVTVLTSVLVIKLKVASEWRQQATQSKDQTEAMSTKDKKATKMVVLISSLLIAMYSPSIILSISTFCEPKFGITGVYKNLFFALWSFGFICNSVNSSINIFMYYNMSSKYRAIFRQVFLESEHKQKET